MAQQLVSAIGVMVAGVFACAAYYWLSDKALQVIFPVRSETSFMHPATSIAAPPSGPGCSSARL